MWRCAGRASAPVAHQHTNTPPQNTGLAGDVRSGWGTKEPTVLRQRGEAAASWQAARPRQVFHHHNAALFSAAKGEGSHPSTTAFSQLHGGSGHQGRRCGVQGNESHTSTNLKENTELATPSPHTRVPRGWPTSHHPRTDTMPDPPHHITTPPTNTDSQALLVSILTFIKKSFDVQKYAGKGCELFLIL